jgi:hypothetical protein
VPFFILDINIKTGVNSHTYNFKVLFQAFNGKMNISMREIIKFEKSSSEQGQNYEDSCHQLLAKVVDAN